jgi:tetratricopeptide (TPR) repeat protein
MAAAACPRPIPPPRPNAIRHVLALAGLLLASPRGSASSDGWEALADLAFVEAREAFARGDPDDRRTRFGRALAVLNARPKTRETIEAARRDFAWVSGRNPSDDLGIRARYFLGRIAQLHQYDADWEKAARIYARLVEEHPAHPFAQLAAVKLVLVRLYDASPAEDKASRFAELEALAPRITHPLAHMAFHYALGAAHLAVGGSEEAALGHLITAAEAGISQARTRATVYVRIGELARLQGRSEIARAYYRRFLAEFPRESRVSLIRERLTALDSAPPPEGRELP